MALYADLQAQHYLDQAYGTVSNQPYTSSGFNCDNPSLFTAEAMLLAGFVTWPGYPRFFDDAEVPGKTGLFHRHPGDTGNISVDEIIGAATLDEDIARSIFIYGEKHSWFFRPQGGNFLTGWNPLKWNWASWMGRYIGLMPYVKFCSGQLTDSIDESMWAIGCFLSPFSSGTSGKLLMWVQIQKMKANTSEPVQWAISFWNWRMRKQYPGGLKDVMTIYFGPSHPLTQYAPSSF